MVDFIRVPPEALPTLAAMVKSPQKLAKLDEIVDELGASGCPPELLAREFASRAKVPSGVAKAIVRQILEFHAVRTKFAMGPVQLVEALDERIKADAPDEWKEKNLGNWEASKDVLVGLLNPFSPLSSLEKRTRLTYKHQNVLYETCLITDARPVFDDTGKEIMEFSITHVLEIDFFDGSDRRSMFAALDSKDVIALRQQCDRAIIKEVTLKESLDKLERPVIITGGENQDEGDV